MSCHRPYVIASCIGTSSYSDLCQCYGQVNYCNVAHQRAFILGGRTGTPLLMPSEIRGHCAHQTSGQMHLWGCLGASKASPEDKRVTGSPNVCRIRIKSYKLICRRANEPSARNPFTTINPTNSSISSFFYIANSMMQSSYTHANMSI